MLERVSTGPKRVRTLFLSDIHLGSKGCQADKLLDFLRHYEADTVYLVGDIVDGWQLRKSQEVRLQRLSPRAQVLGDAVIVPVSATADVSLPQALLTMQS